MSDNERTLELIQAAIDGEATEKERAELAQILANSAEARESDRALREVVARLDAVVFADPSPMRQRILEDIRRSRASRKVIPFAPRRRAVLAAAYGVAAAVVIAFALNRFIEHREHPVRPAQAAAAMGGFDETSDWPVVARVLSRGEKDASLTVRERDDRYAIRPVMAGNGPVSIAWDRQKFKLLEVLPPGDVQKDSDEVTFPDRSKKVAVILQRREGALGPAVVRMVVEGKEISRATINF
jgi:hypothetical protein